MKLSVYYDHAVGINYLLLMLAVKEKRENLQGMFKNGSCSLISQRKKIIDAAKMLWC